MYAHSVNTQVIKVGFALILVIVFPLSAFLGHHWRRAALIRDHDANHKAVLFLASFGRDDKHRVSDLHTRYADLNAHRLGTIEQCITFRRKTQENPIGTGPTAVLTRIGRVTPDGSALAPLPQELRNESPARSNGIRL